MRAAQRPGRAQSKLEVKDFFHDVWIVWIVGVTIVVQSPVLNLRQSGQG